ncbi:MAG: hypothetical protein, partial [Olavius algarvensis Gamma 1 endosymbiont]
AEGRREKLGGGRAGQGYPAVRPGCCSGAPVRWERRHPAGFMGHGGSRRQGEFL